MAYGPKKDLRKGRAVVDISKIAKNPNKGVASIASKKSSPVTDMEEAGYSSTIVSKRPDAVKEKAKIESIALLDKETNEDQKAEIMAQSTGTTVEEAKKNVSNKSGGLSDSFKQALSGLAPSAIGMLVGGVLGGGEGALEGYKQGNAIGNQLQGQADKNRAANLKDRQQDFIENKQREDINADRAKVAAGMNKSKVNLDLKAVGYGNAPVSVTETGKYKVGSKEIPAGSVQNLKIDQKVNSDRLEALKASTSLNKEQLKATLDLQKQTTQDLKNIGLQDITTSMGRIQELYEGTSEGEDFKSNETYKTPSGKKIQVSGSRDAALVINFMKLADPGSVVREGEFNMARGLDRNLVGVLNSWYGKGAKGLLLTEQQRTQLVEAARLQAVGAYENGAAISSRAIDTANSFGIDPNLVQDRSLQRLSDLIGKKEEVVDRPSGVSSLKSKYGRK